MHDPDDSTSISINYVTSICERVSEPGILWIGATLLDSNEGPFGGLNRFDTTKGVFVHYRKDPDDPASLSSDFVGPLYENREGVLWIGSIGLHRMDNETGTFRYFFPDSENLDPTTNAIAAIEEDQEGNLWVVTWKGEVFLFDRETERFSLSLPAPDTPLRLNVQIRSFFEDRSGILWIGTYMFGLFKLDRFYPPSSTYQFDPEKTISLSGSDVRSIYEDGAGILWVGTVSPPGLTRMDRENGSVTHYTTDPQNPTSLGRDIRSILEDREGALWIGGSRMDRATGTFVHYPSDPENPYSKSAPGAITMLEDRDGDLWMGYYEFGLDRLDRETGRFFSYKHDPADSESLGDNHVFKIYQDSRGILWIGSRDGLSKLVPSASTKRVQHEYGGSNWDTGSFTNYLKLEFRGTHWMHEDGEGRFWVGTSGGLHLFDREEEAVVRTFTTRDGLVHDYVYGILEDKNG